LTACNSKNPILVLFDLKSDWDSNTKKLEDIHIFSTGIYLPLSDQWFRRYNFLLKDVVAENCIPVQIATLREK
jgi:hypothetical protein